MELAGFADVSMRYQQGISEKIGYTSISGCDSVIACFFIVQLFIALIAIKLSHGQTILVFVVVCNQHSFSIAQYTGTLLFCVPYNGLDRDATHMLFENVFPECITINSDDSRAD